MTTSRDQALDELAEAFVLAAVNRLVAQLEAAQETSTRQPSEADEQLVQDELSDEGR